VNLSEIRQLVHVGRGRAPYGERALARCYSIGDLRRLAHRRLPAAALGYLEGGGEDEWTLRRNREAFGEVELVPRVLRDVSAPATGTTVLGTRMPLPLVLSPVGSPRMFHHEGELAVARAARHAGVAYGVSTLATQPLGRSPTPPRAARCGSSSTSGGTGPRRGSWSRRPGRPGTGPCC